MKKIVFVCLLSPVIALAQKEIKPSVTKAESALQKGAFDEAKSIIDVTVANQEFMVDKKGNPSKNAAKAWYLKGMIYAGIDTTKVEKFKSLDPDPFKVAQEAFTKAEEIDKGKNESLVSRLFLGQPIPMSKQEVSASYAQAYLTRGYEIYKTKDYKKAFVDIEKVMYFVPNDTIQLLNAGVYFGPQAGETDKSIAYMNKYIALGGKNTDVYRQLYDIYDKRKDYDAALKVAKDLTAKYPSDVEFLNMEYNIYTKTNRLPEAKALMQKRAEADPKDKESRYFLGLICNELKDQAETMKWMKEAIKVDPDYFEANLVVAKLTYQEAQKMRQERQAITGTKPADLAKRQEIFQKIPVKLKEAEVYYKKCLEVKPNDEEALYGTYSLYNDISSYDEKYEAKITELKKKMKSLGLEVD